MLGWNAALAQLYTTIITMAAVKAGPGCISSLFNDFNPVPVTLMNIPFPDVS